MKRAVVSIEGGTGKNVMFTALLPKLKKVYDEIYVISPYYDIFKCCPEVDDAFAPGHPTIYADICLDKDTDILWNDPYCHQQFIKKETHLFDAWLKQMKLRKDEPVVCQLTNEDLIPHMDVSREYPEVAKDAQKFADENKDGLILIQLSGGQSPITPFTTQNQQGQQVLAPVNTKAEALKRNYQHGQQLIDALKKEYPKYKILHFALENEPQYEGVERPQKPYLWWHELAKSPNVKKVVCIDSSLQHLVTGCCKDVTVIWGETRPQHFGYTCNKNIAAPEPNKTQPYFKPLGASPAVIKMPSVEAVMEMVRSTDKKIEKK